MICGQVGGCGQPLAPGSAHVNLESCVQFLLACRVCGGEGAVPVHPRCLATAAAQRGAQAGVGALERKITEGLTNLISGKGKKDPDEETDEDERPRSPRRGGRARGVPGEHWEP